MPTKPSPHAVVWKTARPALTHRQGRKGCVAGRATPLCSREAEAQAVTLAEDGIGPVGPLAPARRAGGATATPTTSAAVPCIDWVVAELRLRRAALPPPHSTGPLSVGESTGRLAGLRPKQLDGDLQALAEEFAVPATLVEEVRDVLSLPSQRPERWQREQGLWAPLGARGTAWYAKPWRSCWGRWCVPAA